MNKFIIITTLSIFIFIDVSAQYIEQFHNGVYYYRQFHNGKFKTIKYELEIRNSSNIEILQDTKGKDSLIMYNTSIIFVTTYHPRVCVL